jgi:hypothetical protein
MEKVVELVITVMVLLITGAVIMYGFGDSSNNLDKGADDINDDTGCEYAQQQLDDGNIDELPERCESDLELTVERPSPA